MVILLTNRKRKKSDLNKIAFCRRAKNNYFFTTNRQKIKGAAKKQLPKS